MKTIVRAGVALVLASTTALGGIRMWEGGGDGKVYADRLAGGLPTGCWGVTKHSTDEAVIVGDVWSAERCERTLAMHATKNGMGILDCVSAPLTQPQFDAMIVFAHNVGITAACASRAFALLEAGKINEGCNALAYTPDGMPNWSFVRKGGKLNFVQGLHNRRKWERELCLTP